MLYNGVELEGNMKRNIKMLLMAIGRAIIWILSNVIFGLLQVWIIVFLAFCITTGSIKMESIIQDGVLLIFASTLIAGIVIDNFLCRRALISRWIEGIIFYIFPMIIFLLVLVPYLILRIADTNIIDNSFITNTTILALIGSIFHALCVKIIQYTYDIKNSLNGNLS
jgi:hypothetical protein